VTITKTSLAASARAVWSGLRRFGRASYAVLDFVIMWLCPLNWMMYFMCKEMDGIERDVFDGLSLEQWVARRELDKEQGIIHADQ
jgi:hypothetical protein